MEVRGVSRSPSEAECEPRSGPHRNSAAFEITICDLKRVTSADRVGVLQVTTSLGWEGLFASQPVSRYTGRPHTTSLIRIPGFRESCHPLSRSEIGCRLAARTPPIFASDHAENPKLKASTRRDCYRTG